MKVRYWMFLAVLFLLPTLAFSATSCANAALVEANGAVKDFDFVGPTSSNYYQFSVSAGHSYSVKMTQPYDDKNTDLTFQVNSENTTCSTAVVGFTDTKSSEPALPINGFRQSFTAGSAGTYSIQVGNATANGRYIALEVSDTTLYSVRWSTYAAFITQWGFQNTTSNPIKATLTATATTGGAFTGSFTVTIPANGQIIKAIGAGQDLISSNQSGYMVVTNDGPPGGLLMDAQYLNPSATVIVSANVVSVRSLQH